MKTCMNGYDRSSSFLRTVSLCAALISLVPQNVRAQRLSAYGGIGIDYYRANSITNFLNSNGIGSVTPGAFTSSVQFLVGAGYAVTTNWEVGIEYAYLINSFSGNSSLGSQQVSLSYSLPSITIRRLMRFDGYSFRFGGAFGYHFGGVSVSSPYSSQAQDFSATGFGLKLDGSLDTKLDERLYARIGAQAFAEVIGQPKAANGTLLTYTDYNSGNQTAVNMSLFGVGVSLGLVYYF
jgi:hypothetical protein